MSSAVSFANHTFTGQAYSSKRLTSIMHILMPETDNCPSWINGRGRMTIENISWSVSTEECCPGGGRTRDLLITSRMDIQLGHRGRLIKGLGQRRGISLTCHRFNLGAILVLTCCREVASHPRSVVLSGFPHQVRPQNANIHAFENAFTRSLDFSVQSK